MSEPAITLTREHMARVAKWATEHGLSASEAFVQLLERGLSDPPEPRTRGQPVHWGDGRYMLLHRLVIQIKRELEHKNGPGKPRVSDRQAIKVLQSRHSDMWGAHPEDTLLSRFYDAQRRLHKICAAYDHDVPTTENQG
jgi:hypothetical protein